MNGDGTLTRSNSRRCRNDSCLRRLALVVVTFGVLVVTNPANRKLILKYAPVSAENIPSWLVPEHRRRGLTNLAIVSLEKRFSGVVIHGLRNSFQLCRYDSEIVGDACLWAADYFCHEKPLWDTQDRPFLAYRLLSHLLIASGIHAFCTNKDRERNTDRADFSWGSIWRNGLLSVVRHPREEILLWTLFQMNMYVFPAFQSLDKVVSSFFFDNGHSKGNDPGKNFAAGVLTLVFVIGGMSNWMATLILDNNSTTRRPPQVVSGMYGVWGACLAFQHKVSSRTILFAFKGVVEINASSTFWTSALLLLWSNNVGRLIAWMVGGMMGSIFGDFLVDKLTILGRLWL